MDILLEVSGRTCIYLTLSITNLSYYGSLLDQFILSWESSRDDECSKPLNAQFMPANFFDFLASKNPIVSSLSTYIYITKDKQTYAL